MIQRHLDEFAQDLSEAIDAFIAEGNPSGGSIVSQTQLANFCIATELLLKLLILKKCPALLFKSAPREIMVALSRPDLPQDERAIARLREYDTLSLDDCIGCFGVLVPAARDELREYFHKLRPLRNLSVHSAVGRRSRMEVQWVRYLFWRLVQLTGGELFDDDWWTRTAEGFCSTYSAQAEEEFARTLKGAEAAAPNAVPVRVQVVDSTREVAVECPVCKNQGILTGFWFPDPIGERLEFQRDGFSCPTCGLKVRTAAHVHRLGIRRFDQRPRVMPEVHWDRQSRPPRAYQMIDAVQPRYFEPGEPVP